MKVRKPIVNLMRLLNSDNNYEYYLHAVTFFEESGYKAKGGGIAIVLASIFNDVKRKKKLKFVEVICVQALIPLN